MIVRLLESPLGQFPNCGLSDVSKLKRPIHAGISEEEFNSSPREPLLQDLTGAFEISDLLLVEIRVGEEELKPFFEEETVIVAYQDDPPSAGPVDQELQALQSDLGELRLELLHRAEVAAAGDGQQRIATKAESFGQELAEARLEPMVAAVHDNRFVGRILPTRSCPIC